ncbi:MAG: carbohydrate ABC transporter permease [Firmicutes bacterium]|nr:carbohydrate ABC transporter permease [Bacillota bacterium]MCL5038630.1 carbohydrate ABC transporter permease [Bacillota bacterium]
MVPGKKEIIAAPKPFINLRILSPILLYATVLLIGLLVAVPFVWMILTSLKPRSEIYSSFFLPKHVTFENYKTVFETSHFGRWYVNSLITACLATTSVIFFDSLAGYALAKYKFRGQSLVLLVILSTMMIPNEMLLIPWYMMARNNGWINTYWGIVFPEFMTAFGVFLMHQFMQGIPDDLLDAGRIDGLSEFGLFWKVALPLVRPALSALAIFTFLSSWNAFLWPVIVTESSKMWTLPVGLAYFSGEFETRWELVMTGATIATVPVLIAFVILQRHIIRGIMLTGLKS